MEEMITKKQSPCTTITRSGSTSSTTSLAMHRESKTISKVMKNNTNKPKIRIIHIFAPEIIKTDVANFRELVQRLTGKPSENKMIKSCNKIKVPRRSSCCSDHQNSSNNKVEVITASTNSDFGSCFMGSVERVKEEEEIWNGNGNNYLGGFNDLDGFIQELGCEFPLLQPLDPSNHHYQFGIEGTQFA